MRRNELEIPTFERFDADYPFGIFKLFFHEKPIDWWI
jgi:hypothetical protein